MLYVHVHITHSMASPIHLLEQGVVAGPKPGEVVGHSVPVGCVELQALVKTKKIMQGD